MVKTTGIGQLLTVLSVIIVIPGVVLTYNGVQDMRVVGMTAMAALWLSLVMIAAYKSPRRHHPAQQRPLSAQCPAVRRHRGARRADGIPQFPPPSPGNS